MVEEKKKTVNLTVKIKDIKLLGFQVTEYGNNLSDPIPDDKYQVQFMLASNLIVESKVFETHLTLRVLDSSKDLSPLPELATMRTKFDLLIVNFNEVVTLVEGTAKLPDELVKMAYSSAIGAARGMFVLCSSVHKFSNAIIPLINLQDLMKNMSQIPVLEPKPNI